MHLGTFLERPLVAAAPLEFRFDVSDADAGDTLSLRYAIDFGSVIDFCPIDRTGSVTISFPVSKLLKTTGTHTIAFYVFDGTELSFGPLRQYQGTSAPVLLIDSPSPPGLGRIAGGPQNLTLRATSTVSIQYEASNWVDFGTLSSNISQTVTVPKDAFLTTPGLHRVRIRGISGSQSSLPVPIWYEIGSLYKAAPMISRASGQPSIVWLKSSGPTPAERQVSLIITDPDNPAFLLVEWQADYGHTFDVWGEFPPGFVTVTLPASAFDDMQPGDWKTFRFRVFNGVSAATLAIVFDRNIAPLITIDSSNTLSFPAAGPNAPVNITLTVWDSGEWDHWSARIRYRFDNSGKWVSKSGNVQQSTPIVLTIGVAEFANHLLWSVKHTIQIAFFDGLEEGSATVSYTVAPPPNTGSPTISVAGILPRLRASTPTMDERTFSIMIGDPDGFTLSVDYRYDSGGWSEPREFAVPGSYSIVIASAEFEANLRPGKHKVTFRVTDGFTSATAVVPCDVNTPPTIGIVSETDDLQLPESGCFKQTVAFSLGDADRDRLTVLYAIDSVVDWRVYRESVTGNSLVVTFTENWPSPRLPGGNHTLLFRVSDGFDASSIVDVHVNVAGAGATPALTTARSHLSVTGNANKGGSALSAGAIAGVAIAALAVIGGVVFVGFRNLRRREDDHLSTISLVSGWEID
jgi:hypothetical protein